MNRFEKEFYKLCLSVCLFFILYLSITSEIPLIIIIRKVFLDKYGFYFGSVLLGGCCAAIAAKFIEYR